MMKENCCLKACPDEKGITTFIHHFDEVLFTSLKACPDEKGITTLLSMAYLLSSKILSESLP